MECKEDATSETSRSYRIPGNETEGEYEIYSHNVLSEGAFGVVMEARYLPSGRKVCAKLIRIPRLYPNHSKRSSAKWHKRVELELQCLLLGEQHPNIVKCLDHVRLAGELWILMEICACGDLHDHLARFGCSLSFEHKIAIMEDTISALTFLHQNRPPDFPIIHRDVKLRNILVHSYNGRQLVYKLADFGLATLISDRNYREQCMTSMVGTQAFMAPELFHTSGQRIHYGTSVDIFSMGLVYAVLQCYDGVEKNLTPVSIGAKSHGYLLYYGQEICDCKKRKADIPLIFEGPQPGDSKQTRELKDIILKMVGATPSSRPTATFIGGRITEIKVEHFKTPCFSTQANGAICYSQIGKKGARSLYPESGIITSTSSVGSDLASGLVTMPPSQANSSTQATHTSPSFTTTATKYRTGDEPNPRPQDNPNLEDMNTLFLKSVAENNFKNIDDLYKRGASLKAVNNDGWAVIHLACKKGNIGLARLIWQKDNDELHRPTEGDTVGWFPCHIAAFYDQLAVLQFLAQCVRYGARDGRGQLLTHHAAHGGSSETLQYILHHLHFDPNTYSDAGRAPLHEAASAGNLECVKVLLRYGAHPYGLDEAGWTPLHMAASNGCLGVVKYLIETYCVAPNDKTTHSRLTPLDLAVERNRKSVVEYLRSLSQQERTFREYERDDSEGVEAPRGANSRMDSRAQPSATNIVDPPPLSAGYQQMADLPELRFPRGSERNLAKQAPVLRPIARELPDTAPHYNNNLPKPPESLPTPRMGRRLRPLSPILCDRHHTPHPSAQDYGYEGEGHKPITPMRPYSAVPHELHCQPPNNYRQPPLNYPAQTRSPIAHNSPAQGRQRPCSAKEQRTNSFLPSLNTDQTPWHF